MTTKPQDEIRSKSLRLNAVISIEDGTKRRQYADLSNLYKTIQKTDLFLGTTKEWQKTAENAPERDTERKLPQQNSIDIIKNVINDLGNRIDVTATKDFGNTIAKANVVVDGEVLLESVPVTHLIFIEKQLSDLRSFISKLPTLDSAREWRFDTNSNRFRAIHAESTVSTNKVSKPVTLYEATKEHPAQTQLITVDEPVGKWITNYQSTALPSKTVKYWLDRVNQLEQAVKFAREEANSIEVDKKSVGNKVLSYIFDGIENDGAVI